LTFLLFLPSRLWWIVCLAAHAGAPPHPAALRPARHQRLESASTGP